MNIRPTSAGDIPALQTVLDETELFPGEFLAGMLSGFLSDTHVQEHWLSVELDHEIVGFCFAEPEPHTDRVWNMRAIAISPKLQGQGIGSHLVAMLERHLSESGQRLLIVDTSGMETFAPTREFYKKNGYKEEARISDFWLEGDDKVVFWKRLLI
ncbi:GNAT family N-acetyltransferase [Hyphobacterium sp.]|uniref:GNAT family N-acetyltransferase n=1 Tax=Hyphobacterium sp. TaxID=2004662 RepID=UPI003BAA49A1